MKKNIKRTFICGMLAFSIVTLPVQGNEADAASVKINKKKLTLAKGECYRLKVKGSSGKVTWKSSNKKIATVSKKGTVTAKKVGTAKITAKIKRRKRTCKVTVKRPVSASGSLTQKPVMTARPESTSSPVITQKPSTSQKPVTSQKPSATTAPESSGSAVTEKSAFATLNSLRSTYPEGMPLTNSYHYYSPRFGNGYGCYGFAAKLSDTVFGTEKAYKTHKTFDSIKVGDNIRIGNSHSVIVLTKEAGYITVVEGNYNSSVHWDRKITATSLSSSGFTVYTRY